MSDQIVLRGRTHRANRWTHGKGRFLAIGWLLALLLTALLNLGPFTRIGQANVVYYPPPLDVEKAIRRGSHLVWSPREVFMGAALALIVLEGAFFVGLLVTRRRKDGE